jgi:DNA-binding PadR family transcriptional regulator
MTPLREPTFLILTALAGARLHGYGITAEVERASGGSVRLRAGTLYAALDRLAAEGLVSSDGDEVVEGRLRRYYVLTRAGAETLHREADRMSRQAAKANKRLKASGGAWRLAGGTA